MWRFGFSEVYSLQMGGVCLIIHIGGVCVCVITPTDPNRREAYFGLSIRCEPQIHVHTFSFSKHRKHGSLKLHWEMGSSQEERFLGNLSMGSWEGCLPLEEFAPFSRIDSQKKGHFIGLVSSPGCLMHQNMAHCHSLTILDCSLGGRRGSLSGNQFHHSNRRETRRSPAIVDPKEITHLGA